MDKEKVTLKGAIEKAEKSWGMTNYNHLDTREMIFKNLIKDLKQLEKWIKGMIPPSTLKSNSVGAVTRKAIAGLLQDILQDILGKK